MAGMSTLIMIYAAQILDGKWSWDNVPPMILPQVEEVFNQLVGEEVATYKVK